MSTVAAPENKQVPEHEHSTTDRAEAAEEGNKGFKKALLILLGGLVPGVLGYGAGQLLTRQTQPSAKPPKR